MNKKALLIIGFNRCDHLKTLFSKLKELSESDRKVYVALDGPRNNNFDQVECEKVRDFVNSLNIPSERLLFQKVNLGCKEGVVAAINWFFSNEEMGLILEDDCIPSKSFFSYCDVLLERYSSSEEIYTISGCNHNASEDFFGDLDYLFSRHIQIWGWASWKRAWDKYDIKMRHWKSLRDDKSFMKGEPYFFKKNRAKSFEMAYSNSIDTWDYQWYFCLFINKKLTIIPRVNLVSNIGFNKLATHTTDPDHKSANLEAKNFRKTELLGPGSVENNLKLDKLVMSRFGLWYRLGHYFYIKLQRLKRRFK